MPLYLDENNQEIPTTIDIKSLITHTGRDDWLSYWRPLDDKVTVYDEAFTIFEQTIELKSYSETRKITPYKLIDGYKLISLDSGRKISIVDKETAKPIITKLYSDEEFQSILLKRKREKRKAFIDKARANPWTHWATLTFSPEIAPESAYNYMEAKKAFEKWRKSIVRKFGVDVKYMAIAEYGDENGRIHWHVLLYFDEAIKFEQARSPKGKQLFLMNGNGRNILDDNGKSIPKLIIPNWKFGIADFYPIYNNPERAINYMAKYMTKGEGAAPYEEQGPNAKSFLSSQGLKKAQKEYIKRDEKSELLGEDIQSKLENAPPIFILLDDGEEIMRKTEAMVASDGKVYALKKKLGVIDIARQKESLQPTTNHTEDSQNDKPDEM
jgi:hypothetical protein